MLHRQLHSKLLHNVYSNRQCKKSYLVCLIFTVRGCYNNKMAQIQGVLCLRGFLRLLSYVVPVKSKVKISQNFVAFSEYMNFKKINMNACGRPTSITLSAPILFVKMANIDVHNTRQNAINAINCMNAVFWEPQYIFSVY